jgi:prepilin-type N-terminal cleavage/methylation domain-containing protein
MWRVVFDHRHRALRLGSHGFSLAEVLIAATVGTIVLLGLYLLYDVNQATFIRGEQQTDLQQNARIGVGRLARELRLAGRDPSGVLTGGPAIPGGKARCLNPPPGTPQAIENAEAACIRFYADVDLGLVGTERVEYSYDAANQLLRRQQWDKNGASNGAQPLAERVTSVTFTYYDGAGNVLVPPVPPGAPLGSIRRVSVRIITADTVTGKVPQPFTMRVEIHPRNLGLNP